LDRVKRKRQTTWAGDLGRQRVDDVYDKLGEGWLLDQRADERRVDRRLLLDDRPIDL
jgi:hypothetical protein